MRSALDLTAVAGVAVAWPVLDAFGRSPEAFVARRAGAWEVVAFGLLVFAGPPGVLLAVEGLGRAALRTTRRRAHDLVVALVGGVALARWCRDALPLPWPELAVLGGIGLGGATAVAAARRRWPACRRGIRLMGVTSAWYLVAFLALSPTGALVRGGGSPGGGDPAPAADRDEPAPAPVVLVVFDALPTTSLLDGHGALDGRVAPHLARLARDATWYRGHTTVSGWTLESLGAIATGTLPDSTARRRLPGGDGRSNVFSLLDRSHDLHAYEPVTRLCPVDRCPLSSGSALPGLLGDAASLWWRGGGTPDRAIPAALDAGRLDRLEGWVDGLALGGRPDLVFVHALPPHDPFDYLPDGRRYRASNPPAGIDGDTWGDGPAADVARRRHLLQVGAADALLGRLVGRLADAGLYDDALVVVTADHGIAFDAGEPSRGVTAAQFEQVLWTPLLVKAPGQSAPRVVDEPTRSTDVLPTIAGLLGAEVPWAVDGTPAGRDGDAGATDQVVQDWVGNELHPAGPDGLVPVDGDEGFARVLDARALAATGPHALWRPDGDPPLVGRPVDELRVTSPEGPPAVGEVSLDGLDRLEDVDVDAPLPLEVVGEVTAARAVTLALALNGVVAATVTTDGPVHALLLPDAFAPGRNALDAYVVAADRSLTPVAVRPG